MELAENSEPLNLSTTELIKLRQDLLATVYAQTLTKLSIYQRAQLLNATRFIAKKSATKAPNGSSSSSGSTSRRSSLYKINDDNDAACQPDEKVLNELQLDRELDALRHIYTAAYQALSSEPKEMLEQLHSTVLAQNSDKNKVELACAELRANQNTLKALKNQLSDERQVAAARLRSGDERIAAMRHNLRNVRLLNALELRLVQQWEENRYTQACIVGENEERALSQQIAALKRRIAGEQCIIREVDKFSALQSAELRGRIGDWQQKYAAEMQKMQAQIQEKEQRIMQLQKSLERHKQTYAERVQFVQEYLEQKEIERLLYEQEMHRVHCAVQIQAWWRGVMVRRGLGPFKKKTKGKGKKGKGAKGAKAGK